MKYEIISIIVCNDFFNKLNLSLYIRNHQLLSLIIINQSIKFIYHKQVKNKSIVTFVFIKKNYELKNTHYERTIELYIGEKKKNLVSGEETHEI